MGFKIKNVFLLIILILLQSCSGGRIGNFLESSFKNIKEPKIKEDAENKIVKNVDRNIEINKNIKEPKIKEDAENKIVKNADRNIKINKNSKEQKIKEDAKNNLNKITVIMPEEEPKKNKVNKQNISRFKRKYQPQSYKIIFILKDVDPKDPIENLSTILRNSDVNFEIEKIERFFDSKKKL